MTSNLTFFRTYTEMEGDETKYFQDIETEHANDDEEYEDEASVNQDEGEMRLRAC